ncbi:carbamoyltransferase [Polymorphospora lycopeni]|uniref:Carbamoyltransferase C-terminal domain-containing protein n=1 Tax=Polymorphospora lycopeni TaxID=3140240 RepID=A0ABV5CQF7_9ACTN
MSAADGGPEPGVDPSDQVFLGVALGPFDPAVAAVRAGQVVAYAEEERFVRSKHAIGRYPSRALRYCLEATGRRLDQVAAVAVGWDCAAYSDGRMAAFYDALAGEWDLDPATVRWQRSTLRRFSVDGMRSYHHRHWRREFGDLEFPPLRHSPHHYTHAFQAAMESPFESAVTLTVDGSGDADTTVLWLREADRLRPLRRIRMPHSLGWFYAAFTEYLGFEAYDGEYKVMGLAAHGRPDPDLSELVGQVLMPAPDGIEFRLDPTFIHYGQHTYSDRYTDKLVKLLGAPPRLADGEVSGWHMDLAYAVQHALEEAASRLVRWAVRETGVGNVCVGGGVGLNVRMNSRLLDLPEVADVFAHPLCADGGGAAGAALVASFRQTGRLPSPLTTLALGPEIDTAAAEAVLRTAHIRYEKPADLYATISRELADGRIVGWCQGRMEAGPRALGQRSILADPRTAAVRDRVNRVIKYREMWRPFGPAMLAAAAGRYLDRATDSRFMTMAFPASGALRSAAPAVVHRDGTSRVQLVHPRSSPGLHRLLTAFDELTGVPVLLNTSFNVRGEPIVCTVEDAVRTFFATGLDLLVLGDVVVRKDPAPEGAR